MRPSRPKRPPSTSSNHTVVAIKEKPIRCLKVSIQAPGLGKKRMKAGTSATITKGSARPMPATPKNSSTPSGGKVKAKPMAEPSRGALQGVASSVVNTPVRK